MGPLVPLFRTSVTSPLGFKTRVGSALFLAEAYVLRYMFHEIHLWCDTWKPLGGQCGSRAVSSTYLQGIGGTRIQELSYHRSQCEISQTLYRLPCDSLHNLSSTWFCFTVLVLTQVLIFENGACFLILDANAFLSPRWKLRYQYEGRSEIWRHDVDVTFIACWLVTSLMHKLSWFPVSLFWILLFWFKTIM